MDACGRAHIASVSLAHIAAYAAGRETSFDGLGLAITRTGRVITPLAVPPSLAKVRRRMPL